MAAAAGRVKLREAIDPLVLAEDQLSEVRDPDQPFIELDAAVHRRWPALAGAASFPVVSDGFSSNMGAGAVDESAVAASLATSGAMRVLVHSTPRRYRPGSGAIGSTARARCWVGLLTMWAVSSAGCSPRCGSYPGTTST
jgi:sugar (pentulose or hexulose) kinase